MSNPTIAFRLSPYQIARGLWIVRKLEPDYQPASASKLVKLLYLDYLAKMSIGRSDIIPPELINEVKELINLPDKPKKKFELDDIIARQDEFPLEDISKTKQSKEEESIINTVTNFRPPTDWMNDIKKEEE